MYESDPPSNYSFHTEKYLLKTLSVCIGRVQLKKFPLTERAWNSRKEGGGWRGVALNISKSTKVSFKF